MNFKELQDIPYFSLNKIDELQGRLLLFAPFYVDNEWEMPIQHGSKIIFLKAIPSKSNYISNQLMDKETDIYLPFVDFFYKHASWRDLLYHINGLTNDIENLFTSIAKIDFFHTIKTKNIDVANFVATEMEYILITSKSLFDSLQKIFSIIWKKYVKLNISIKNNLPETFRKMIFQDKKRLSKEEIENKFSIPSEIATYYYSMGDFYEKLKILRDDIVHHNKNLDNIFVLDKGFAISKDSLLFKKNELLWEDKDGINNLFSIRPLLNYWISSTIDSCNDFIHSFSNNLILPKSLFQNHNVYIRSPNLKSFIYMKKELKSNPWWKDKNETKEV
jgi:hypothetical protein